MNLFFKFLNTVFADDLGTFYTSYDLGTFYTSYQKYYLKCASGTASTKEALENCITFLQKFLIQFLPSIVILALVIAGVLYIAFSTQPNKLNIPLKIVKYTLIGAAIILGASILFEIIKYIFLG